MSRLFKNDKTSSSRLSLLGDFTRASVSATRSVRACYVLLTVGPTWFEAKSPVRHITLFTSFFTTSHHGSPIDSGRLLAPRSRVWSRWSERM